jgi:NADH-quinone oxidoreductase subunit J
MTATILFYLFAVMAAGSGICVVFMRDIVRMSVALLFSLTGVAGIYFLLSAEFLAAAQLVIYVGGTLILIIFGVMLTSKHPFSKFQPKPVEVVVALILGVIMLGAISAALLQLPHTAARPDNAAYPIDALGLALLGDYLLPFELSSVVLLVVMIGAAYLAKARRRKGKPA